MRVEQLTIRVTVTVECPKCKATRRVGPGEVPEGEVPMCEACLFPMFAVSAEARPSA